MLATLTLFGQKIASASREDILGWALAEADSGRQLHAVTLNAEMVVSAESDAHFACVLGACELVIPDGRSIARSAGRILGEKLAVYPGIEFAFDLIRATSGGEHSAFLLGSREGVADRAADRLRESLPGCRIAGTRHGYFKGGDEHVLGLVNDSAADILLLGLGSPYQEYWLEEHREKLRPRILVGVGGCFEVWSGALKRAPAWMNSAGLEWLYRALIDPRRIRRLGFVSKYLAIERAEIRKARIASRRKEACD